MEVLIVIACTVICAGYYFLYYAPKKKIENFAHLAQKAGYKVKLMPFEFLGYFLVNLMEQDQKNLMVFKTEMTKYDIVVGNMMTRLAIVPSNPQILKDMFNQMSKLEKDGYYSLIFQTLNGGGIPFTQGQSWKRKRKIISSVFHFDFLNKMIPVIQAQTEAEFKKINEKIKNNESVNLFFLSSRILSLVISKCFFGVDPSGYKIQDQPFCQYYIQTLDQMSNYSKTLENIVLGINAYKYRLTPKSRRLRRRVQLVHAIVKEITLKSLEIAKERRGKQTNLLTVLYDSNMLVENGQNDPNKYSVEELIGEFFAFFGAGTDTTANTLNMAMHYLSEKNFYLDRIKEELEVLDKDSVLNPADKLKNMKWIDAVFSESLRINGPVASLIPRVAVESFTAGGLDIPKGSSVSIFVLTNHYKTENFEKPLEFYPQRWMENSSPKPYSYLPFGGGERNCIGQYLARIQAKIIMSKFINTYEFKAKSPIKMQFQFVLTNASRDFELKIKNESK